MFAGNSIVLVKPSQSSLKLAGMDDLKKPEVRRIGIGNPQTVPAGRYAGEVLAFFKLSDVLKEKLIMGENVRQVLDYVVRGEVDAGIVYKTDALTQPTGASIFFACPASSSQPGAVSGSGYKKHEKPTSGKNVCASLLPVTPQHAAFLKNTVLQNHERS